MNSYSPRFESAVKKLYLAFHDNRLNPECCNQCAVGNILDNRDFWKHFAEYHGATSLTYVGKVNEAFGKRYNGYSPAELLSIEQSFLAGCGYTLPINGKNHKPSDPMNKDLQFKGLEAVVQKLCELDGVDNLMECSSLFAYQPLAGSFA